VTRYAELLRQAESGRLLQRNLQQELARVAADRLALHEDLPEDVAWKRVRAGEWAAPPAVRAFLKGEEQLPSLPWQERLRRVLRLYPPESARGFRKELEEAISLLERYGES
jgi:hypothetical protein